MRGGRKGERMTKDDIRFPAWATRNMVVPCPGREDSGRGAEGKEAGGDDLRTCRPRCL